MSSPATRGMRPLLKWPGGKRWLVPSMMNALGLSGGQRLVEPFVGGGALFFATCPSEAVLGDTNGDLIACYRALRDTPARVIDELLHLSIDRSTYSNIVSYKAYSDIERAVKVIYLNRTAFAGIWRVNLKGQFNVPFGCKPETRLPDADTIGSISSALQSAKLYTGDFDLGLAVTCDADFIYCDPPYTVSHNNNGFIRYNERIFGWADQMRLATSAIVQAQAERRIVISNAAHSDVLSLYPRRLFARAIVHRRSDLAASTIHRGDRQEALIVSKSLITSDRKLSDSLSVGGLHVEVA